MVSTGARYVWGKRIAHSRPGCYVQVADWRFADCGSQALSEKEDAEQKHNAAGRDQQGEEDITNVLKYS